jgi:hypothetical protein
MAHGRILRKSALTRTNVTLGPELPVAGELAPGHTTRIFPRFVLCTNSAPIPAPAHETIRARCPADRPHGLARQDAVAALAPTNACSTPAHACDPPARDYAIQVARGESGAALRLQTADAATRPVQVSARGALTTRTTPGPPCCVRWLIVSSSAVRRGPENSAWFVNMWRWPHATRGSMPRGNRISAPAVPRFLLERTAAGKSSARS